MIDLYTTLFTCLIPVIIIFIVNNLNSKKTQNQLTSHHAKAIVLHCMDFRLVDDIVMDMNDLGLNNNYDDIVLAGTSLLLNKSCKHCDYDVKKSFDFVLNSDAYKNKHDTWYNYFVEHVKIAINLHNVEKIILIEHEDCGAYKIIYGSDYDKKCHLDNMKMFKNNFETLKEDLSKDNDNKDDILKKIKELTLEFYMVDLKGKMIKFDV